jgi:pimeloyl-ACP methyl ester carboxylesterase
VRGGAEILVNTTNDAWFGTSSAPEQHLAMAALRAVENGRSVVRAANTGISCIIDPQGQIRQATELFTTTSLTADVAPRTEITPYTRMGDWIFVLSAAVLVAAAALAERRRGREVHAEMEVARRELDTLARQPVPLRRPLVLLPGYDSGPHRWQSFRWHLGRCFTDAVEATWIDTARDASIAELASSSLEVLEAIGSPRDYVGHSLGALVAVQIAESGSRVVALAVPLEGSMWARIAGWARFAFPRQLRDLSPGSPALSQLRERVRQLPGWMGLRLSGDPLSGRPPVPLTGSHRDYQVPALMSPWSRHREVHADPRIIRDVIVALRSETLAEDA